MLTQAIWALPITRQSNNCWIDPVIRGPRYRPRYSRTPLFVDPVIRGPRYSCSPLSVDPVIRGHCRFCSSCAELIGGMQLYFGTITVGGNPASTELLLFMPKLIPLIDFWNTLTFVTAESLDLDQMKDIVALIDAEANLLGEAPCPMAFSEMPDCEYKTLMRIVKNGTKDELERIFKDANQHMGLLLEEAVAASGDLATTLRREVRTGRRINNYIPCLRTTYSQSSSSMIMLGVSRGLRPPRFLAVTLAAVGRRPRIQKHGGHRPPPLLCHSAVRRPLAAAPVRVLQVQGRFGIDKRGGHRGAAHVFIKLRF